MNIFEFAMEKEKFSEDYYRLLSGRTSNKGFQSIFAMLADEEAKHYRIVSRMKNRVTPELAETSVLSNAKDIFVKMKDSSEKFNFDISEIELYKKAQKIEKESENFYLEKVKELTDAPQRKIFEVLANEEDKHYFLLENMVEFVSQPDRWLENAEWHHMDEY